MGGETRGPHPRPFSPEILREAEPLIHILAITCGAMHLPCTGKAPSIFASVSKAQIGLITQEVDVMSPATFRTMIAGAVMLLTVSDVARAQSPEAPTAAIGSRDARVRGLDQSARHILQRAAEASPTIVRMLAEPESTDLMVGIETAHLARFLNGEVHAT